MLVETAVGGKTVTRIYEGERAVDVQLRYPEDRRDSAEAIGNLPLRSSRGEIIPLSQVADIVQAEGPSQISRESGERRIGIECNISGRDLGGFVAEARREIGRKVAPSGRLLSDLGRAVRKPAAGHEPAGCHPADDDRAHPALALPDLQLPAAGPARSFQPALRPDRRRSVPLSFRFVSCRSPPRSDLSPFSASRSSTGSSCFPISANCGEEGLPRSRGDPQGVSQPAPARSDDGDHHHFQPDARFFSPRGPARKSSGRWPSSSSAGLVTSTLMTLLVLPALYARFGEARTGKRTRPELVPALLGGYDRLMNNRVGRGLMLVLAVVSGRGLRSVGTGRHCLVRGRQSHRGGLSAVSPADAERGRNRRPRPELRAERFHLGRVFELSRQVQGPAHRGKTGRHSAWSSGPTTSGSITMRRRRTGSG